MTSSSLIATFIPANTDHIGGANGSIDRIVVHATVSACVPGGARGNAHYFQSANAGGAAHYVVDPKESVGCVDEERVAHHAPPNTHSIGVELCDWQNAPGHEGNYWGDQPHQQMLGLGGLLVRDIADRTNVPKVWRSVQDLRDGKHGITSHANVALAFRQSTHTDPGPDFPVEQFMAIVQSGTSPVKPHPQETDMQFIAEFVDKPGVLWLVDVAAQGNGNDHDPTHKYGTRTRVIDPPTLWRLASHGIPVRSGKVEGMEMYTEKV